MSTTTLFVELLIIGFQVCVWLFLAIYSTFGADSINFLDSKISKYPALTTALLFAFAYVMGIFFDKLSKYLLEETLIRRCTRSLKFRIGKRQIEKQHLRYQKQYAYVMVRKGQPMTDLQYAGSKVRILRASIVNIPLITMAAMFCMVVYLKIPTLLMWISIAVTAANGMVLTLLFTWLYTYNEVLHHERLQLFYDATKKATMPELQK